MAARYDASTLKIENADNKTFEQDAPTTADIPLDSISPAALRAEKPKFFGTIAYPYTNGSLHVGHGFTISKVELATGYARMKGKRALFPLGFNCTGMAIKACADKLVREMEDFGQNFERYREDKERQDKEGIEACKPSEAPRQAEAGDVTKFKSKKSKMSAKSVKAKYQFQIMLAQGIPREDVNHFADPYHWVYIFPEAGMRDVSNFGLRVDWRPSFVTTDANPYYDFFVRWQMNRIKELGKIKFGKRYAMYSPKDGQPCLDHDRSEREGIGAQEFTAVKMKNIVYGVFNVSENEYLFLSSRAARNMAFQGIFPEWGSYTKALDLRGQDVIGPLVDAPLSAHSEGFRVLAMETVKETKGTGVVTSAPSDSPDDYATATDLVKKVAYYGIKKRWAELEIIPIIETPDYGSLIAPALVEQIEITSSKDPGLPEAKEQDKCVELNLKKQLDAGLSRDEFLGTELPFNELVVLKEMVPGLLQTSPRCKVVEIARVSGDETPPNGVLRRS
ncbi:hypothetical protein B0T24DRAFT_596622 [Lasiosphaeria ovina]|uniref:leucine--tRNA ligase n=1 Tax=Lasiosphaeria ovina TaxID=92902 RepID=A0AAE0N110_9PEZI|nr:hypothetical protein B0T24DRAFT_596622 [Lasiosphaeria ovina]